MGAMYGRCAQLAVIPALLLAGCGSSEGPTPLACIEVDPAPVVRALERVPGAVTLADGTSLSRCVRLAARSDGDLQQLGERLMRVADDLRARAAGEPVVALRLGYLVGAVRRGAAQTPGLAANLARRLEQVAALDAPAQRPPRDLRRGIRLGEAGG
jgi:hypothetical protein